MKRVCFQVTGTLILKVRELEQTNQPIITAVPFDRSRAVFRPNKTLMRPGKHATFHGVNRDKISKRKVEEMGLRIQQEAFCVKRHVNLPAVRSLAPKLLVEETGNDWQRAP